MIYLEKVKKYQRSIWIIRGCTARYLSNPRTAGSSRVKKIGEWIPIYRMLKVLSHLTLTETSVPPTLSCPALPSKLARPISLSRQACWVDPLLHNTKLQYRIMCREGIVIGNEVEQ
jgi:hypothetical protein